MNGHDPLGAFWQTVRRAREALTRRNASPSAGAAGAGGSSPADVAVALDRLDAIRDECRAMVTRRASLSAGAAIVPLPGLDVGTDVAILMRLLPRINEKFGLSPGQIDALDADTKRIVMMFVGAVGSSLVGRLVTRELVVRVLMRMGMRVTTRGIVKFVPLLGQALSASISFGAMRLLGNRHIDDCYEVARGTLLGAAPDGTSRATHESPQWELLPRER